MAQFLAKSDHRTGAIGGGARDRRISVGGERNQWGRPGPTRVASFFPTWPGTCYLLQIEICKKSTGPLFALLWSFVSIDQIFNFVHYSGN